MLFPTANFNRFVKTGLKAGEEVSTKSGLGTENRLKSRAGPHKEKRPTDNSWAFVFGGVLQHEMKPASVAAVRPGRKARHMRSARGKNLAQPHMPTAQKTES